MSELNLYKYLKNQKFLGKTIEIKPTFQECKTIEKETKEQSKVRVLYDYRAGRVTASVFKSCCRTNIQNPSMSLIKSTCYPSTHRRKIPALNYGCQHENKAAQQFTEVMKKTHTNFWFENFGFLIHPNYSYFGASPDGLVGCDCCGLSLVEIKCPFCARFSGVTEQIENKDFYLHASKKKSFNRKSCVLLPNPNAISTFKG